MLDVGVVIARFQVPRLTAGHHAVLSSAAKHAKMIVMIGCGNQVNDKNPLDYVSRLQMVQESYPDAIIVPANDVEGDDKIWSEHIDRTLEHITGKGRKADVTFYGGRDSFWPSYEPYGVHKNFHMVHQVSQEAWSGSTDRAHVLAGYNRNNEDFRRGVIYGVCLATQPMKCDHALLSHNWICESREAQYYWCAKCGALKRVPHNGSSKIHLPASGK